MSSSRHFIESSVADIQKEIDAELVLWLSGKKNPGIVFSGSIRDVYWGTHLDEIVAKITDRAFETALSLSAKHDINPIDAAKDAGGVAENAVRATLEKMIDFDRRMCGKGFPMTVSPKNTSLELERSMRFILRRKEAEVAILEESIRRKEAKSKESAHHDKKSNKAVPWLIAFFTSILVGLIIAYLKGCFPSILR